MSGLFRKRRNKSTWIYINENEWKQHGHVEILNKTLNLWNKSNILSGTDGKAHEKCKGGQKMGSGTS